MCGCVCVCVYAPEAMNNKWRDIDLSWLVKQVLVLLMGLAIETVDGRGLSNEARREFLSNKTKVTPY